MRITNASLQHAVDSAPRQRYAVIAAVDIKGGFSKEGQIPWYYSEDFQWFKQITSGEEDNKSICAMGRKTYEDINTRLGQKAIKSVLPNRRCFVLSNTLTELPNATVVKSIREVEFHNDNPTNTIFIIGGNKLFTEGVALAHDIFLTVINKDFDCDKHFPMSYLFKHFAPHKVFESDHKDLRFFHLTRK